MDLSIVSTLYNSERYVDEFYQRIVAEAERLALSFEIVFVDDGSPDDSLRAVLDLAEIDSRITVVELSRNHGHHRAMLTGLEVALGDKVFLVDVDLEERPENLSILWHEMNKLGDSDVVFGVQEQIQKTGIRGLLSRFFYIFFNAMSRVKISDRELVSRLMTRRYVDALIRYKESELFLPALWVDVGFKQSSIVLTKEFDGQSSYTLAKRLRLAVDAITSFSSRPLMLIFYGGITLSTISTLFILYLVIRRIAMDAPILGWTSTLASIYLVGGLILFSLGIIGIYLSKIFLEVKGRPYPIIRKVVRGQELHNDVT